MKKALWVVSGLVLSWATFSIAPDMWRYWKIHTM